MHVEGPAPVPLYAVARCSLYAQYDVPEAQARHIDTALVANALVKDRRGPISTWQRRRGPGA